MHTFYCMVWFIVITPITDRIFNGKLELKSYVLFFLVFISKPRKRQELSIYTIFVESGKKKVIR